MLNLLSFAGILKSIGGVLLAVAILLVMVTIHEFGHYIAGKLLGFKINEFAVGFGPALYKKRSKKTGELFALRAIPLGGYCAFDGEDEIEETPKEEEPFAEMKSEEDGGMAEGNEEVYPEPKGERFNDQPPWKRIIVLIAGASMNYILALFLIVLMFACFGRPVYKVAELMPEEGIVQTLQVNDTILEIDGKRMYMITDYMDVLDGKKQGDTVNITVLRDGEEQDVVLTLQRNADFVNMSDTGTLLYAMGVNSMYAVTDKEGFFQTIGNSFAYSVKIGGTVLRSLGELLTGKLGMDAIGGPITTIKVTSEVASSGLMSFLNIAAFIGVNLAVFNLLPVPALDGSKVIFCLIEWIRKKPVNRKVETMILFIGIIFLFGFAILVDILQLF
ncbi:MAG: site-2 protease family protein [Clostridia bacterium]|nr:site-2 protease family protein [Clostridia bacterium]